MQEKKMKIQIVKKRKTIALGNAWNRCIKTVCLLQHTVHKALIE